MEKLNGAKKGNVSDPFDSALRTKFRGGCRLMR